MNRRLQMECDDDVVCMPTSSNAMTGCGSATRDDASFVDLILEEIGKIGMKIRKEEGQEIVGRTQIWFGFVTPVENGCYSLVDRVQDSTGGTLRKQAGKG